MRDNGRIDDLCPRREMDAAYVHVVRERMEQRDGKKQQQKDQDKRSDPFRERFARFIVFRRSPGKLGLRFVRIGHGTLPVHFFGTKTGRNP